MARRITFTQTSYLDDAPPRPIRVPQFSPAALTTTRVVGRFLNLGAGVQSSTLAEMVVVGALPPIDAAVFADTGNEPQWVYQQVAYLEGRLTSVGIPLIRVVRPHSDGIHRDLVEDVNRWVSLPLYTRNPVTGKKGMLRRQCTNEYKITPINNFYRAWLDEKGHVQRVTTPTGFARRVRMGIGIEVMLGISLDEIERMRTSNERWKQHLYPLVDQRMSRMRCEGWLRDHDLPVPKKSSCAVCPYHDDGYWLMLRETDPQAWAAACRFDDWLRTEEGLRRQKLRQPNYLHRTCTPLREVGLAPRPPDGVVEVCGEHCFV